MIVDRAAPARWGVAVFLALTLGAGLACSGASTSPNRADRNDAVLTIQCNVPDAELWVDDRFVAEVSRLRAGVAVAPGEHRIELRHDRHYTHYEEFRVAPRERRTFVIEMADVLP